FAGPHRARNAGKLALGLVWKTQADQKRRKTRARVGLENPSGSRKPFSQVSTGPKITGQVMGNDGSKKNCTARLCGVF
ncbi:hypothetical protein, partial [Burkholderia gladioli]|uniref:hypothetical protein n=1 Tax=Burkholderia gladioli TaxID=28095 RepID=UPI001C6162A5